MGAQDDRSFERGFSHALGGKGILQDAFREKQAGLSA